MCFSCYGKSKCCLLWKKAYKSDSFGKIAHNINIQEKKHAVHVL